MDGCPAVLVRPTSALPGNPWIWRAEFFDAFPAVDLALLEQGFYLAYINVGDTWGCPDALAHWDVFYRVMTERYHLSGKPALEGLSRGGLYVYNWAARNTGKVGCLYGDAPVCDLKSTPGGKGCGEGMPESWQDVLRCYHFRDEAEALAYRGNPVDNLEPLAKAGIPIIHVCGDADTLVPMAENTAVVQKRYRQLGGEIVVIVKEGIGHHPHGLPDPTPVVAFIVRNCASRTT